MADQGIERRWMVAARANASEGQETGWALNSLERLSEGADRPHVLVHARIGVVFGMEAVEWMCEQASERCKETPSRPSRPRPPD